MELSEQELPIFQLLASLVFSSCLGLSFGCWHTHGTDGTRVAPGWTGTLERECVYKHVLIQFT